MRRLLAVLLLAVALPAQSRFFNTVNDVASAASGVTVPTTKGTVMLWVYPTVAANDGAVHAFLNVGDGTTENFQIFKYSDDKLYAGWFTLAGGDRREAATASWTQNAWNTITYVWATAGGTSSLLVNGSSLGGFVDDGAARFDSSGYPFKLGNFATTGSTNAASRIAHVVIWNDVLNGSEITALANRTPPWKVRPGNRVNWWPVDGVRATEPDYSTTRATLTTIVGAAQAGGPPIPLGVSGRR